MLEYVYFDFTHFGSEEKVSSLDKLLKFLDRQGLIEKLPLAKKIARDVANGVHFLHQRDIVHRDIKTANVLMSNQHYCSLENQERIEVAWSNEPIRCKLADFGESRSLVFQTDVNVLKTATSNIVRGTPAYRAPEVFSGKSQESIRFSMGYEDGIVCHH
jgi:serine/threonine protein kinase